MVECEIVFAGDKYTIDLSQYPQTHINRGDRNTADIVRSAGTVRFTEPSCHCASPAFIAPNCLQFPILFTLFFNFFITPGYPTQSYLSVLTWKSVFF